MNADSYGDALDCTLKEITKLHETIAAQAAVIEKLRDAFVHIQEYWNGDANEGAMFDALTHIENVAHEALSIPTDSTQILDEVRRAEREKCAKVCELVAGTRTERAFKSATELCSYEIRAME